MKRFLTVAIISLALAAAGAAPAAHADPPGAHSNEQYGSIGTPQADGSVTSQAQREAAIAAGNTVIDVTPATPTTPPSTAGEKIATPAAPPISESYFWPMIWIMNLFAWLVGVAALALNSAVFYTVVRMGSYVSHLPAIGVAWHVMRDVGNIALIFGFMAAGIATIIDLPLYGWTSKMLPTLIIAAVFLNFSLFISEAVIDTGNLFATQIYSQINANQPAGPSMSTADERISNAIMDKLGLTTIYDVSRTGRNTEIFKAGWYVGFLGILLFLVTAFVLFSLAFILVARFVFLIYLIITAPIGFAGWIIPNLKGIADQWWSNLFEQTFVAPVLLLLLYIALRVILDNSFLTGFGVNAASNGGWLGVFKTIATGGTNYANFGSMILSFLVAMGLLLVVIMVSKKMSAFGADWATSMGGKLTFGATGYLGRATLGWGATRTGKYFGRTWVGRVPFAGTGLVKGLDRLGKSSFDVRGAKQYGNLDKTMSLGAGTAQKGGYQADLKTRIKTRTDYAENLIGGRELTKDEKERQAFINAKIQAQKKAVANAKTAEDIVAEQTKLKAIEKEMEDFENTARTKGAQQRKYANVLNLGEKPNTVVNFFNPMANTQSAKDIIDKAKKGKVDKDMASMFKRVVEETAGEAAAGAAGGGAAPAGGGGPAAGGGGAPGTP